MPPDLECRGYRYIKCLLIYVRNRTILTSTISYIFYLGGASIKNISKIRLKLIQGKPVPGIYLITLSENPHNQLEILPALTLVQETAARICPEIVGIAKGKEEALELITDMVQTIYKETGELNIKEYWKNR